MLKNKKRIIILVSAIVLMVATGLVLGGCSSGGGSDTAGNTSAPSTNGNTVTANGVRLDIEQYITSAYPNSAKKRAALMGYAKSLQTAYTAVNTQAEAIDMEPKIIRALSCTNFIIGEYKGSSDPTNVVDNMTANTPERLTAQLKYEKLLDGKVFTISSPDDTVETVCDFNPNALPN